MRVPVWNQESEWDREHSAAQNDMYINGWYVHESTTEDADNLEIAKSIIYKLGTRHRSMTWSGLKGQSFHTV